MSTNIVRRDRLHLTFSKLVINVFFIIAIFMAGCGEQQPTPNEANVDTTKSPPDNSTQQVVAHKNEISVLYLNKAQFQKFFKPGKRVIFQLSKLKSMNGYEVIAWRNKPGNNREFESDALRLSTSENQQYSLKFDDLNVILGDQKISLDTRQEIENRLKKDSMVIFIPDTELNTEATKIFGDRVVNVYYKIDVVSNMSALKSPDLLTLRTNPSPPASTRLETQP